MAQLLAPNRIDKLEELISEAGQCSTALLDTEDKVEVDYQYAQTISKLVKAKDLLDALITSATDSYVVMNEED